MRTIWKISLLTAVFLLAWGGTGLANHRPCSYPGPADLPGMRIAEFVRLSAKDFSRITGAKLTLKDRVSFSVLKWQMKKPAKKNPDMTVSQYMASREKKNNTVLIIAIVVVVVVIVAVVIANSVGPGNIGWGEGG